jgi:alpha-N-arabinofuranosidase
VPLVTASAAHDEANGHLTLFVVNRGAEGHLPLEADLRGFGPLAVTEHRVLEHDDPKARNTHDRPDTVAPHARGDAAVLDGQLTANLPPLSWNVIRLAGARP